MPSRMGKIPNFDKFDASFFGILPNKVATVDVRLSESISHAHNPKPHSYTVKYFAYFRTSA